MSSASKRKGSKIELEAVKIMRGRGLPAEKVPLSGALGGAFRGDINVPILDRKLVVEVKARAKGFVQVYKWLEDRDALIIRADRKPALIILPLDLASEIAAAVPRSVPVEETGNPAAFAASPAPLGETAAGATHEAVMHFNEMFPSKFMKADSVDKPTLFTIKSVAMEDIGKNGDRKPVARFTDGQALVINKINATKLKSLFGSNSNEWLNKQIVVYPTTTDYAGEPVQCLRLRAPAPRGAKQAKHEEPVPSEEDYGMPADGLDDI